jgi:hypothetical protein
MRTIIRTLQTTIKSKSRMRILKHLIVAALFLGAFQTQAEVVIYQAKTSVKWTGEGFEGGATFQEFLVWNLDDNHVSQVFFRKVGTEKRYSLDEGTPLLVVVDGSRGRQYTTFSGASGGDGRNFMEFNRGQNANLPIGFESTYFFPRVFKGTGHILNTVSVPQLTDYSRTAVFSAKRTQAANDAGQTEEEAVASLVAELQSQGYIDPDAATLAAASVGSRSAPTIGRFGRAISSSGRGGWIRTQSQTGP